MKNRKIRIRAICMSDHRASCILQAREGFVSGNDGELQNFSNPGCTAPRSLTYFRGWHGKSTFLPEPFFIRPRNRQKMPLMRRTAFPDGK